MREREREILYTIFNVIVTLPTYLQQNKTNLVISRSEMNLSVSKVKSVKVPIVDVKFNSCLSFSKKAFHHSRSYT